ncbi:N-acylneuraminate-9-phosphate synthase [Candidatus Kaiserbacteria bacterium CG10_big_fil_rev_8_21_14_0_10_49_17]|uniref:N-acylneuraminate-9-phosphate synthase n=1 Tax=Candidatus Kaiserbacteria bacterium CG10_big_fil_rev_8_21_14_0_10_49_17 TaxID=1974609 RepID=A0A2M6WE36_9BACT|nr:MAG: N-acylneuraminate-9-phosphate synthase [Candidatus Kaiserbacteria bacterium CG10_big_fil_rev_8_21_14_0_10_49_17]
MPLMPKDAKIVHLTETLAVGPNLPMVIIAEGGLTNWGELSLAKKQVDAAMAAGCDVVKFQAQTTEALVSETVSPQWYRRLKYKELSYDDLRELREYCAIRNIEFLVTAHTEIDLDFLDKDLNVPFFKVGSGESVNEDFLANVGSRGKPVIISVGMHKSLGEICHSVAVLEEAGCRDIVVLHCSTVYPTPPSINYLRNIEELRHVLSYPVGYSDHTVGLHAAIAARAMGAMVLEKHLSFNKRDKRSLDCPGSATPEEWYDLVEQIREVEAMLSLDAEARREAVEHARTWARQSIVAAFGIKKGQKIKRSDVALKRPGTGLPPHVLDSVVGSVAHRSYREGEYIELPQ